MTKYKCCLGKVGLAGLRSLRQAGMSLQAAGLQQSGTPGTGSP